MVSSSFGVVLLTTGIWNQISGVISHLQYLATVISLLQYFDSSYLPFTKCIYTLTTILHIFSILPVMSHSVYICILIIVIY